MENGTYELARRDTLEKEVVEADGVVARIEFLLEDIQRNIFEKALNYREGHITEVDGYDEFKKVLEAKRRVYFSTLGWNFGYRR